MRQIHVILRLPLWICFPLNRASQRIAPVAQLDRALPSGGRGQGFESLRARQ